MEVAGTSDTITFDQMLLAEGLMISRELKGSYDYVYGEWKDANASNLHSTQAAYNAGVDICKKYERPYEDTSVARGNTAKTVYGVMMKNL
jgi:hypothetical protein